KGLDDMRAVTVKNMKEALKWDDLKQMYFQIYSESFTQEEVDGMLAFYESPAGKAVIKKMPVVMQKSMTQVQQRILPLVQKSVEEAVAMQKAREKKKE